MKTTKITDLYLWSVRVTYLLYGTPKHKKHDRYSVSLLITTKRDRIEDALQKTRTIIKRNRYDWSNAKIVEAKYTGTLDA